MSYKIPSNKWTIRFAILTPVLAGFCIFLIGGGHGWYAPAMMIFPWATFNTIWQDHLSELLSAVGLCQFIVYGILIDKTEGTKNQSWVSALIVISHLVLATAILIFRSPEWR